MMVILMSAAYSRASGWPTMFGEWSFLLLQSIGHWFFLTSLFLLAPLLIVASIFPFRALVTVVSGLLALAFLVFVGIDITYYTEHAVHLSDIENDDLVSLWEYLSVNMVQDQLLIISVIFGLILILGMIGKVSSYMVLRENQRGSGRLVLWIVFIFVAQNAWFYWAASNNEESILAKGDLYPLYYSVSSHELSDSLLKSEIPSRTETK